MEPLFFITILLFVFLYFLLASLCKRSYLNAMPPSPVQSVSFCTAMVLLYIVKGSPVDLIGHILFSVHMLQMSILFSLSHRCFCVGCRCGYWKRGCSFRLSRPLSGSLQIRCLPLSPLISFFPCTTFRPFSIRSRSRRFSTASTPLCCFF